MNCMEKDIDTLTVPGYCKRHHSGKQIDRAVKSLKAHGQYQPIVVSGDEILCGVLIWTALKRMGVQTVWVNDLGFLTPERKKEIRYLDNQIFDIETWEETRLKDFLVELDTAQLDNAGFEAADVEALMNMEKDSPKKDTSGWNDVWECESCGWKGTNPERRPEN